MNGDKPYREEFVTPSYPTKEAVEEKIRAVVSFHVVEGGWNLLEKPEILMNADGTYFAKIKLEKPINEEYEHSRHF